MSKLSPGKAQYSLLLNESGGIVDDIIVYCMGENDYMIVLNAGCKDSDWDWLQAQAAVRDGVILKDISDLNALIAVQGPKAVEIATSLAANSAISELKRFHFAAAKVSGAYVPQGALFSRTGYTGEDGFEILCGWNDAPALWAALVAAGATPAGLGARDVLRLEAAYSLYGHELDAQNSPLESGVGWAVKMKKGEFVGREALRGKAPAQQLVGLQMDGRAIPREHYTVTDAEGRPIGETTSGTWSPTIKAGIAMARLRPEAAAPGTEVFVDIRGRQSPAKVVTLPFYRNGV